MSSRKPRSREEIVEDFVKKHGLGKLEKRDLLAGKRVWLPNGRIVQFPRGAKRIIRVTPHPPLKFKFAKWLRRK
jgi:hypothetical protein